ncbi:helix-turn-helix transcriptional regulator [Streptomonospora arabica]|uniref:Helix-turn-helix transcriptional regulator n=1 Tax=Streptomonospora arabica TaxID=412417 RepID=A0ABV9SP15_9ACTN
MDQHDGSRADIRDFLISRRAKITPELAGLPGGSRRRVPGLRREEVAVLAGVSTEWYTRLEKGHIGGVSEDVLAAVAQALQLDEDERTHLFDLARAARAPRRRPQRRKDVPVPPRVQWLLDSATLSAGFIRNGRLDVIAHNALARSVHAPLFDSNSTDRHGRPNFARFHFLDPAAADFFVDWEAGARITVALLRAETGRHPDDPSLRQLVGELSTLSGEFRTMWATHDVRIRHDGAKRLNHPEVGTLKLVYQSMELPLPGPAAHELTFYTAEPGTTSEDRLKLLASWTATRPTTAAPADPAR